MNRQAPLAIDRILALGEKASRYSEAELARKVGVSRERIRQLKAQLPHKPVNTRKANVPGYSCRVEQEFYTGERGTLPQFLVRSSSMGMAEQNARLALEISHRRHILDSRF